MAGEPLSIGVALGTVGVDAEWWLESAQRLDDAGYAAVWAWDHLMSKGRSPVPVLEQWTTLAAAAATTRRIGLGTWISGVTRRHPAVLARMAATVQAISGGRLRLGLGIGGFEREHRAYGLEFAAPEDRGARLEEAVAVIRALWTGEPVTRPSRFYPLDGAVAVPRPEPRPPILIGAQSPAGVRRAARIGDGWAAEIESFEAVRSEYLAALAAAGRGRSEVRILLGFESGRSGIDALDGSPWIEDRVTTAARWRERGVDEVVLVARTTADVDRLVATAGT